MTNTTTDTIPDLLRLDPSDARSVATFRTGIARLAGWTALHYSSELVDLAGYPPDSETYRPLPPYETSLDAALTLPIGEGAWWDLHISWTGKTVARIAITISSKIAEADPPYEASTNAAWSASRAWLKYRQAELARRDNQRIVPDNPTTTVSSHTIEFDTGCERDESKGGEG